MTGIYLPDLKGIVRWACDSLGAGGDRAVVLTAGTMLCEGGTVEMNLFQRTGSAPTEGIAWGLGQMEKRTHDSLWDDYLAYRPELKARVAAWCPGGKPDVRRLFHDIAYMAVMTRVRYLPDKAAIPAMGDDLGMAAYWKRVYNTELGAGAADSVHAALFSMVRQSKETSLTGVV